MADVFISYKSERRAAAEHLAEILGAYGYSVWWDYGLVSGRDFGAQIETELRSAKAVVVLWCSLSVESEWVREEAALAKRLNKIIPTFIEKVDLPLGFSLSQTLDLADWDGAPQSNKLERLLRDIAGFVGRAPSPDLESLDRTERAWRRFGSLSLREFALIDALERNAPPRKLPIALPPEPANPPPKPDSDPPERSGGKMIGGLVAAAALALLAFLIFGTDLLPKMWTHRSAMEVENTGSTGPPQPKVEGSAPETPQVRACPDCPEMVVIPAGALSMGIDANQDDDERPPRDIAIARSFAVGRFEVTRGQYAAFVRATSRDDGGNCETLNASGAWVDSATANWRNPGFTQGDDHPVVCVSWHDAQEYLDWLSEKAQVRYRLLSEAEWEYAARAREQTPYVWGSDGNVGCAFANGGDATLRARYPDWSGTSTCSDGALHTARVGSYRANAFELSDMIGNAWEWTEDCYTGNLNTVPTDGSAYNRAVCPKRVLRGGSWVNFPKDLRSSNREGFDPTARYNNLGFRVARTL